MTNSSHTDRDAVLDQDTLELLGSAPAECSSQDLLIAVEEHSAVHAALDRLESGQRQLLALAYFRGYTHGELAQFTGIPLGTVKTQLRRTLIKLKEFMIESESQQGASV